MSGSSLTAPSSINDVRTKAHLTLGQRLGTIDLSPLLIYTLLNPAPGVLPLLQWQFDLSSPLWSLLGGEGSQVALVQQAILLHRYQGTLYAIGTIMAALGFPVLTIREGQDIWGGTEWPSDQGWAAFRVIVTKATGEPETFPASWDAITDIDTLIAIDQLAEAGTLTGTSVSATQAATAVAAIDFFKPARCWLDSLWFAELPIADGITVSDSLSIVAANYILEKPLRPTDSLSVQGWAIADTKTTAPLYSAHFYHSGITYGPPEPAVVDSGITINGTPTE